MVGTKIICQEPGWIFGMPTVDDFDRRTFGNCWAVTSELEDDGKRRKRREIVRRFEPEDV